MNAENRAGHDSLPVSNILIPTAEKQSTLTIYLAEVNQYPRLNQEQQESLFRRLRVGASLDDLRTDKTFEPYLSEGNERYAYAFSQSQTLEEMAFRCNLDLVVSEARRYPRYPTLDLIQEGNIGLMKAIERHNPELGKFTSYARWWIRGAMFNVMPDLIRSAHIPSGMRRRINMVKDIETELSNTLGNKPSEQELRQAIHERTGLSRRTIDTVFEVMNSGVTNNFASLDEITGFEGDTTLYDFISDPDVDVEEETIARIERIHNIEDPILIENEEYKSRRRPSAREAAIKMGRSLPTAQRALRRLVEAGLLPLHPRDPRTVDETGLTEHTRRLDALVEEILKGDPKLRNKEVVALLADPSRLGIKVSILTVERSRLRLADAGKAERRILNASFYEELDKQVEELLKTEATIGKIAEDLKQPKKRIQDSAHRLRKEGRAESRVKASGAREAVAKYLKEHTGEKINRSAIARQLGITRERVRQIYDQQQSQNAHTD